MKEVKYILEEHGDILENAQHSFSGFTKLLNKYSKKSLCIAMTEQMFKEAKERKELEKRIQQLDNRVKTYKEFYSVIADKLGVDNIVFNHDSENYKIVLNTGSLEVEVSKINLMEE